ncbi:MAG: tetratricopeptide repeat protein [Myxococcales bacterium]|nr:tetratricopeptide repeat protein [Myxococcales bacterium]USN49951.1 MAG: tetratricopeptide repeat protein [Myxococcales bacterium]
MKRSEIRALADEVYATLDEADADVAVLRAMDILAKAPKDVESFLLLSEVFEEKALFEQSLNWIEQGLKYHPDDEALLLKKASILLDNFEDVDEAFAILKQIKKKFKDSPLSQLKKDYDEALLVDVYLLLSDCFRLKNNFNQALEHAQHAIDINSKDEAAILSFATALLELGNFSKAMDLLDPSKDHEKSDFLWVLGQLYCAMGSFEKADSYFAEANKIDRRYHRPVRLSQSQFFNYFEQAILVLPKEIRDFVYKSSVRIEQIVPQKILEEKKSLLSPLACVWFEEKSELNTIYLFQKNIENLACKKSDIKDLIASAMLHEIAYILEA